MSSNRGRNAMRHNVDLLPSTDELRDVFLAKYGQPDKMGPMQRLWRRVGYYSPDDFYEALVAKSVHEQTSWLDVGCGRNVFPGNERLADLLARRCRLLVGVDPDATLLENRQVHQRIHATIDEVRIDERFD